MLRSSIFRERAQIRSAQPEPIDGLLRVTAPHEWMLLACLAAMIFLAAAWSGLARVDEMLVGDGALAQRSERYAVVSTAAGVVTEVAVAEGDHVEVDQILARLELPEVQWRLRIARARVALLEERARDPNASNDFGLASSLAAARAEVTELAALDAAGATVVSPRAGEITANSLVEGSVVRPRESVAEIRLGERGAPEAFLFVRPEDGRRIEAGMPARVTVMDSSSPRDLVAEVAEVSGILADPPEWLSRVGLVRPDATGSPGHLVRLTLSGAESERMPGDGPCRVKIVTARHSPLGLLLSSTSRLR
ncbi:MAG: HlyD family efflux transporter periplasmic adaptor subunit [Rhodobacteraceae bacterium]|nr:HlyD family efflux transporter periplasmic adaptor subunit [Paracoccaceae bacterium]